MRPTFGLYSIVITLYRLRLHCAGSCGLPACRRTRNAGPAGARVVRVQLPRVMIHARSDSLAPALSVRPLKRSATYFDRQVQLDESGLMSSRDRTLRDCGNTTSAGSQPISPSGHFAHFAPVNGLSNQAPGRQPASRLRAPCASIIAFDPRGRCSCDLGREYRTSGTRTSLIAGKRSFAEPWRPSIHSTSARAKSGTCDHGTPVDVTSPSTGSFVLRVSIKRHPSATLKPSSSGFRPSR